MTLNAFFGDKTTQDLKQILDSTLQEAQIRVREATTTDEVLAAIHVTIPSAVRFDADIRKTVVQLRKDAERRAERMLVHQVCELESMEIEARRQRIATLRDNDWKRLFGRFTMLAVEINQYAERSLH